MCAGVCECQQGDVLAEGCWMDPENVTAISTGEKERNEATVNQDRLQF